MPGTALSALHLSIWPICTKTPRGRYMRKLKHRGVTWLGIMAKYDLTSGRAGSLVSETILIP